MINYISNKISIVLENSVLRKVDYEGVLLKLKEMFHNSSFLWSKCFIFIMLKSDQI